MFRRIMGRGDARDGGTGAQDAPSDGEEEEEMEDALAGDAPVAGGEQVEQAQEPEAEAGAE